MSTLDHSKLDRSFIQGIAWTGMAKWSIQLFTWTMTLAIARILTPEDYGIVAMATVYIALVEIMVEFGIGNSIVTLSNLSKEEVSQFNGLSLILSITGFIISGLLAMPLGWFFEMPALPSIVVVMSLGFIINAFRTVPCALLQKEHRFKALSVIATIRSLIQSIAIMVFAMLGLRYWSLVLGMLVGSIVNTGLILLMRRHKLAIPFYATLRNPIRFSWQALVSKLSWYIYSNVDFAIGGRILGQVALGYYSLAWTIACAPMDKVTNLIGSVTPAFYSKVKDDPRELRRYLLKPVEAIALILFPIMVGLTLVAKDAILTLLGKQWEPSIPVLQLLAMYACIHSFMPLFPQVLMAVGDVAFVMWNDIFSIFVLSLAFYIGSHWGIKGIAAAWLIAYPVNAFPLYWRVHQKIGLSHTEFFRAILPAINGTFFMLLTVVISKFFLDGHVQSLMQTIVESMPIALNDQRALIRKLAWLLDGHFGSITRLIVQVALGGAVYLLTIKFFHGDRLLTFRRGFSSMSK